MGLFSKADKQTVQRKPALLFDEDEQEFSEIKTGYNEALDYLVGLSDEDYAKVCKVAEIYRKANAEALEALDLPNEPTTFIQEPQPEEPTTKEATDDFLDDELETAFLEDLDPSKDGKQPKQPADKK